MSDKEDYKGFGEWIEAQDNMRDCGKYERNRERVFSIMISVCLIIFSFGIIQHIKASEQQCYDYMDRLIASELNQVTILSVGKELYDSTLIAVGLVLGQCVAYEKMRDSENQGKTSNISQSLAKKSYDDFAYIFYEARRQIFLNKHEGK